MAVDIVPQLLGGDRCLAASWDRAHERFTVHAHSGFDDETWSMDPTGDGRGLPVMRTALDTRLSQLVPVAATDERLRDGERRGPGMGAFMAIPVTLRGEMLGVLGVEYRKPRRFSTKDEVLARGIARQVGIVLANARRYSLLQELRSFSMNVGSNLSLDSVTSLVADGAMRLLAGAGACLYLVDSPKGDLVATRTLGTTRLAGGPYARLDLDEKPWKDLKEGKTVLVTGTEAGLRDGEVEAAAVLAAPIMRLGLPLLGAVLVLFDRSIAPGIDETEALNVLAAQAAMAIENAQRFERQRSVARSLQAGVLSTELPKLAGFRLSGFYEPASGEADIGGDFYDAFEIGEGRFGVVVGDVSGKGAVAAAQTAQAKYMLRAFASRSAPPSSVMFDLNNVLVSAMSESRFTTILYGVCDSSTRRMQLACAGHPPPLLYRAMTGTVEVVEVRGMTLGLFVDQAYEEVSVEMDEGDVFVAYTDGLVDARSGSEPFGRRRVEEALARLAPHQNDSDLTSALYEEAKRFGAVNDDTVVFALVCGRQHR